MVEIAIFSYASLLLILLFLFKKSVSLLSIFPLTICYMLCEVPFLIISYKNTGILYQSSLAWVNDLEETYILHIFVRFIFLISFVLVCYFYKPKAKLSIKVIRIGHSYFIFLMLVVISSYLLFIYQVGGLNILLRGMSEKSKIVRGSGLTRLTFVYSSLLLAAVSVCYYSTIKKTLVKKFLLFLILFLVFLMLASYGERKNAVVFLCICAISWSLWVNKISLFSAKMIFGLSLLVLFSALAPPLREAGAVLKYSSEPSQLFVDSIPHLGELFRRFSDIDISIFIFNYFDNSDKYFYMSTLPNFFTGIIPAFLYPNKPPLDEAVIIYNLAQGVNPGVNAPFKDFIPVGWPVSRYTAGWVQFGVIGVFVYSIFTSIFLVFINNIAMKRNSPFIFPLYILVAFTGFGLSNTFIFNFLIGVAVILFLYFLYRGTNALLN